MHININELWIGDTVRLKKSMKIGKYEGLNHKGKLKVRVNDKIILTTLSNIEQYELQESSDMELSNMDKSIVKAPKKKMSTTVDLHVDGLDISLSREPQMILRHQMQRCERFVHQAIAAKMVTITIIHGKGAGELRKEVHLLLGTIEQVTHFHAINDGGATEVWLK
jgi:dsDNA-specific endonuclease/ATPase MutS2